MSLSIHLILFSIYAYLCNCSDSYRIIPRATIETSCEISDTYGYKLQFHSCSACLCNGFSNSNVILFTCTETGSNNFTCQFYYFMPARYEVKHPVNKTNIYLLKNKTFEERGDFCNTTYLVEKIKSNSTIKETFFNGPLRFLAYGDNNTIVSTTDRRFIKFDASTFKEINGPSITGFSTVGFDDTYYYLGDGTTLEVYDKNLTHLPDCRRNLGATLTTIRALSNTEILVGTDKQGAKICKKQSAPCVECTGFPLKSHGNKQVHAFGVVNQNAFYIGWDEPDLGIHLYRKGSNDVWDESAGERILRNEKTSDIVIDNCNRVWAVHYEKSEVKVYEPKSNSHVLNFGSRLFNLLVMDDYTIVASLDSSTGLKVIRPSFNYCPTL